MFKIPRQQILLEYAKRQLKQELQRITFPDGSFSISCVNISLEDEESGFVITVDFHNNLPYDPLLCQRTGIIRDVWFELPVEPQFHKSFVRSLVHWMIAYMEFDRKQRVCTLRQYCGDTKLSGDLEQLIESFYPMPEKVHFKCRLVNYRESDCVYIARHPISGKARIIKEFPLVPKPIELAAYGDRCPIPGESSYHVL